MTGDSPVGDLLELDVGAVAHGGHCVARHEGRVVFVRHTLPGERVRAVVTDGTATSRFLRADAVEVLRASPDRVEPRCPYARPGRCGGCDWQHASLSAQRGLKAAVVAEQLRRLAGIDRPVEVEQVPGDAEGLGWRTRVRFTVDAEGRPGLRRHRSHAVVPLSACPLCHPLVRADEVLGRHWPGVGSVEVAVSTTSQERIVVVDGEPQGRARVTERVAGRDYRVTGASFWQVHPGAAEVLVAAVREGLAPHPGETVLDLYAGVGLFAGTLGDVVGPTGRVDAVEASASACRDARRSLHDLPWVRLHELPVERFLAAAGPTSCDLVVLDPPRAGAGRSVVEAVAALRPRAVAYVACDPASLARDLATFAAGGLALAGLRAFDVFPLTHHVECVAILRPASSRESTSEIS